MFLINFQLWARNRDIPGAGGVYVRGGFNVRRKRFTAATTPPYQLHLLHPGWAVADSRLANCDSCRRCRGSGSLSVATAEVAEAHLPHTSAGEVAEAQAPKLRQQLELQTRRGRNCQTTGGRIVRKRYMYRAKCRCCQECLNTPI